jgi:hypothetical protein
MARAAAAKAAETTTEPDMDEGRFAPIGDDVIEGEVVQSTEKAIALIARQTEGDLNYLVMQAKAELDQSIVSARAYPRSIELSMKATREIATLNPRTAARCGYAIPRGKDERSGKANVISGPSVWLARIVAPRWGNCHAASRPTVTNRDEGWVEAEGVFHDWESNFKVTSVVRRSIRSKPYQGKPGRLFSDDMINVTANAAAAIAYRNAVFQGVPEPIWNEAYEATLAVVRGDLKTLAQRRLDLIGAFRDNLEITPSQLFTILGVAGENDIGLDELVVAAGFYSGLKNKEITVEDLARQITPTGQPPKSLAGAFGGAPTAATAKPEVAEKPAAGASVAQVVKEAQTATTAAHDPKTGEVVDDDDAIGDQPQKQSEPDEPAEGDDAVDEAVEEDDDADEGHVAGSEKTDPAAFLRWAPTAFPGDLKPAFTALSRTPAYKALDEATRDMIAAAVTGEAPREDMPAAEQSRTEPDQAEETAPRSASEAVGAFWSAIDGQESWLPIKAQVGILYKTDEFRDMDAAEQRQIRIEIWEYVAELVAAKKDPLDFAQDPAAFRLWIETTDDPDAIEGCFRVLKTTKAYANMQSSPALDAIVADRIHELRSGG